MSILIDTTVASASTAGGFTTFNFTVPVANNQNRMLVVGLGGEVASLPYVSASSITYAGQSLSKIGLIAAGDAANAYDVTELWYLIAPPVGSNILSTTFNTVQPRGAVIGAISLYGVKQAPPDVIGSSSRLGVNSATAYSSSITTTTPNSLVVDVISHAQSTNIFQPTASRIEAYDLTATGAIRVAGGYGIVSQSGTTEVSWSYNTTLTGGQPIIHIYAAFAPYSRPSNIVRNIDNTQNILFSDDFNRANGSIGSNYQVASGSAIMQIISNQVYTTLTDSLQVNCVSTGSILFPADQESQITVAVSNNSDIIGPAVRVNPTNGTCYAIFLDTNIAGNRRIIRINGNTSTTIGSAILSAVSGDIWSLRAIGNRISAYRNGVLMDSVTDNTYSSGQPGLFYSRGNTGGSRMDSFIVRNVRNAFNYSSTGTRGRIIGRST